MPSRADLAQQGFTVTTAKATNGETVHINDHVYVSPPFNDRDGSPYSVARILEFLPPSVAQKKGSRHHSNELHVRLSLYYRPNDISGRAISDYRLLLGTIHTVIEPISVVRGRCYVRHKDKISDLIAWKHTPDHFYFHKFFDPYSKREYEVVRTVTVNNIPPHVKEVLLSRYEYLLTEKEMVADLLDAYRSCCVCNQWAASQDTVRCEVCKQFYHMSCLNPPLLAKPAKGYSWACLTCTIQRRKDVESEKYRFVSNGGSAPPRTKAQARKDKAAAAAANEKIFDKPDVMFRGWPWRYFGLHTRAEDTLDAEDLIYPRAVTRVGTKFQANVLTWEEQQRAEEKRQSSLLDAGSSRLILERGYDPGEQNHDPTLMVLSEPSDDLADYMEEVRRMKMPVPPYDIRRLNAAVEAYTAYGREQAIQYLKSLKLADFNPIVWTEEERRILEAEFAKWNGLQAHAASKVLGKRPAEVVRYAYAWKNKKYKAENELLRQHRKVHSIHGRTSSTLGPIPLGHVRRADSEMPDDDASSLYNASYVREHRLQCAVCWTRISNVWWKCPRSVTGNAMCETCGSNYRKYGVISAPKADDAKREPKKEPKSRRGAKADSASGTSTPVPQGPPKLPPCSLCRRMEPKASMARCKTCTFSAHAGCYGIRPEDLGPEWECELCANVTNEENNLDIKCMLCPRDQASVIAKVASKHKRPPADFDALSALKPTEGCRWAHILCASWTPEVQFSNGTTLKDVEGISAVADASWEAECTLCGQSDGAKIPCTSGCGATFHVSCAYLAGYKLGFFFSPVKAGKREVSAITTFKDEAGIMSPGAWCKGHEPPATTDMFELDPELGECALHVFNKAYKTIPADELFPLLRKAKRLDRFEVVTDDVKVEVLDDSDVVMQDAKVCASCGVDVSPRWYESTLGTECHKCSYAHRLAAAAPSAAPAAPQAVAAQ